jgi:hypothetical protein
VKNKNLKLRRRIPCPSNERPIVPRKAYATPVRFNVITQELAAVGARATVGIPRGATKLLETIPLPQQGETVDLSERGIRFKNYLARRWPTVNVTFAAVLLSN